MLGCLSTSTIFGVRIHCEQSRVGNVLSSLDILPPIDGVDSMRYVVMPESAVSNAAWIPATPAPMIMIDFSTGMNFVSNGWSSAALATDILMMSLAFAVAFSGSFMWIHEDCSRMLAISKTNGFNPPAAVAFLKVGSCRRGEHAATTTASRLCSLIASLILDWPGVEHM